MSNPNRYLNSGAPVGVLHNMSVPPRTEVRIAVRAVHGVTAISLSRALWFNRGADPERMIKALYSDRPHQYHEVLQLLT
jgi:hypothetical protein